MLPRLHRGCSFSMFCPLPTQSVVCMSSAGAIARARVKERDRAACEPHGPHFWISGTPPKPERHVERLADIVEIVMGALRAEAWFRDCIGEERLILPLLFDLHVLTCRLVQQLDARLATGYLKWKRKRLNQFDVPCTFSQLWIATRRREPGVSQGLLLCGLLRAASAL